MKNEVVYPLGKERHVTIDPRRQFGAPCVRGRIPTECLYGMFTAGDSIERIASWYEIEPQQVIDAIQYETMRRCKVGRKYLKKTSEDAQG